MARIRRVGITMMVLILLHLDLLGQKVLEFDGAYFLEIELAIPPNVQPNRFLKDTVIIVPSNSIWKIEGISVGDSTASPLISWGGKCAVYLNRAHIYGGDQNSINPFKGFPIWLPSGNYHLRFVDHYNQAQPIIIRHYFYVNITAWRTSP